MRRATLLSALALGLAFSGCGGGSPHLTPVQQTDLRTLLTRARTAAQERDLPSTRAALDTFAARVRSLRDHGDLAEDRAQTLLKFSAITTLKAARTIRTSSSTPAPPADSTGD